MKLTLKRDVLKSECPWLHRDFSAGEEVFSFSGVTYGCVSQHGRAVTLVDGELPFFELPRSALTTSPASSGVEGETVAWLHPTANWCDVDRGKVLVHCLNDGPYPIPLYRHPASPTPQTEGK